MSAFGVVCLVLFVMALSKSISAGNIGCLLLVLLGVILLAAIGAAP